MKKSLTQLFLGTALSISTSALAAPPEGADPALSPFFKSLTLPGQYEGYCCNENDCRSVDAELRDGRWWALASKKQFGIGAPDKYLPVKPENIIKEEDLPKSKRPITAVGCYYMGEWRCFLPAPQSF